jgi:hypothetical protein
MWSGTWFSVLALWPQTWHDPPIMHGVNGQFFDSAQLLQ